VSYNVQGVVKQQIIYKRVASDRIQCHLSAWVPHKQKKLQHNQVLAFLCLANKMLSCSTSSSQITWAALHVCRAGLGLQNAGLGRARALYCGLGLLWAWVQKFQARGLCPKTRPARARAFGLFSISSDRTT
jgi:hypothetical protein